MKVLLLLSMVSLFTSFTRANTIEAVSDELWMTSYGKFGTVSVCLGSVSGMAQGIVAAAFLFGISFVFSSVINLETEMYIDMLEGASAWHLRASWQSFHFCSELVRHLINTS